MLQLAQEYSAIFLPLSSTINNSNNNNMSKNAFFGTTFCALVLQVTPGSTHVPQCQGSAQVVIVTKAIFATSPTV